jgi:drug/metabolite transporter (DMT)-like permease
MAKHTKAYLAVIYICIIWGTTYLAIRIGVLHYPAFLFAGVRQTTAGIILLIFGLLVRKKIDLSAKNILQQMLIGFLLLSMGNGCVTWGEKYVSSGVAALICSLMPIFAVAFNLILSKKEKLNFSIALGMLLGFSGVALIFRHNISDLTNPKYITGILVVLLATICWSFGSMFNRKQKKPENPIFNVGMQLFFGGLFMLIESPVIDDYSNFIWWNGPAFYCLLYLIVFGSALAYAAYMYALGELPVGIATIYAYINPLVAVVVAYLAKDGELNIYIGMAFITIVLGVYLVNMGYRKQHAVAKMAANTSERTFPENLPADS